MLIESIIKRAGGTFVKLGDDIYHFFTHVPGDDRHLSEVDDEDHIQTFLAIKEGYRLVKMPKKAKAEAPAVVQVETKPAPDAEKDAPAKDAPKAKAS